MLFYSFIIFIGLILAYLIFRNPNRVHSSIDNVLSDEIKALNESIKEGEQKLKETEQKLKELNFIAFKDIFQELFEKALIKYNIPFENVWIHPTYKGGSCIKLSHIYNKIVIKDYHGVKIPLQTNQRYLIVPEIKDYSSFAICMHEIAHYKLNHHDNLINVLECEYEAEKFSYRYCLKVLKDFYYKDMFLGFIKTHIHDNLDHYKDLDLEFTRYSKKEILSYLRN